MPERIQLSRKAGWRLPEGTVIVDRRTRWGNPFAYRTAGGLARVPAALQPGAEWEYEGRISAAGMLHNYFHPDGRITICRVRFMTRAECAQTYRRAVTGNLTPAMRAAFGDSAIVPFTIADIRAELAGRDLACWCPLTGPCHADVLLWLANSTRPWTPDVRAEDGTRITVRRCCNGCGLQVGDASAADLEAAMTGRVLPDVTGECPDCSREPRHT